MGSTSYRFEDLRALMPYTLPRRSGSVSRLEVRKNESPPLRAGRPAVMVFYNALLFVIFAGLFVLDAAYY
jgi:hypothetical protein